MKSPTKRADAKKKRSKAVAFGREYFHALGGLQPCTSKHEDGNESSYYSWDCPPWASSAGEADADIVQAEASSQSTIFLTKAGKIYQTGTIHGQIYETPTPVITKLPLPCVEIAAGRHFCLGRVKGGVAVFSWGAGHFGQLGLGSVDSDRQLTFTPQPMVIQQLLPHAIGSPIKQIAAGDWHALALTESGRIWAWGSNRSHQCGRKPNSRSANSQATTLLSPMPIPLDVSAEQIGAGRSHSVAIIKDTRQIYCWGSTLHGQCGNVVRKTPVSPHLVDGLSELSFRKISVAGNHTLALTTGGRLFSWGDNSEGQLGHSPACPALPKAKQVQDLDFVAVAVSHELKKPVDAKEVYDLKKDSKYLKSLPQIVDIYAGAAYSIAKSSSGHIYCFGSNDVGQLGVPVPKSLPVHDNTNPPERNAIVREMDIQVFDSRHILLLPMRNSFVDDMFVETMACGPNHMWIIGRERTETESQLVPGQTLQEMKNQNGAKPAGTVISPTPSVDNVEISAAIQASPKDASVSTAVVDMEVVGAPPLQEELEDIGEPSCQVDVEQTTNIIDALPQQTLQIQTGPNALIDSLVPLDAPTPSTVGEFAGATTPSPVAADAFDTDAKLPSNVQKSKKTQGSRGVGVIRGISLKFRRRFGGKKRAGAEADASSDTEHNANESNDQAK